MSSAQPTNEAPHSSEPYRSIWSRFTYTTRVTAAFAAIAAMTALVAVGVLSFVWEGHFQTYTNRNVQTLADHTAKNLAEQYMKAGDRWTDEVLMYAKALPIYEDDIDVRVFDKSGTLLYDSSVDGGGGYTPSLVPTDSDKKKTSDIIVGGEAVGKVRVWVNGQEAFLTQDEKQFRENSYQAMLFATAIAILLALAIGFLFARSLVAPINRMTRTAKAIKEGDLSARTNLKGDDEIARLGETFDAMAESVEKDREMERRLTTDVAHELRTPLMAIQSTVEAMVDGIFEPNMERLETLNSEVQRLGRLVDALLRLFRLENRSSPMKQEKVNVGELVESIVVTHEAFVIDSGLSLDSEIDEDVYVCGDADMIRQATVNLISNAVRYTPEGGKISVEVRRGDIMAAIAVKDTGIGLSPEEVKMVFSRFWRADAGRTRESGGLGIGLAVVKEIVSRHGGWVNVEGKPDEGAIFTIYIPLYDEEKKSRDRQRQSRDKRKQ